jgi:hypothetical protein
MTRRQAQPSQVLVRASISTDMKSSHLLPLISEDAGQAERIEQTQAPSGNWRDSPPLDRKARVGVLSFIILTLFTDLF